MNTYNDEPIGFETLLPAETIDLLNNVDTSSKQTVRRLKPIFTNNPDLDEYELAMAA